MNGSGRLIALLGVKHGMNEYYASVKYFLGYFFKNNVPVVSFERKENCSQELKLYKNYNNTGSFNLID